MLLGLHTYSLHLHGMGQDWGGYKLQAEPAWDIFGLLDEAVKLGLDGLHLTAVDLGSTEPAHLAKVRAAAEERGLYLEYNFSMDSAAYDIRLQNTIPEGIAICRALGSDLGKISMDIHRPHPVCGTRFHHQVMVQLKGLIDKLIEAAPLAAEAGVRLAVENHTEAFSDEVLWVIDQVDHPFVGACVDTNNSLMVGEDPIEAVAKLAPRAFCNHFSDHAIRFEPYGCRFTGVATGTGDCNMPKAYQLIRQNPVMKRLNMEVEFDPKTDDLAEARRLEYEAVVQSIKWIREELGVKREEGDY